MLMSLGALAVFASFRSRTAVAITGPRRRGACADEGNASAVRWRRWVKQFAAIGLVAVLAMLLFSGHGPSAHLP
jgi:hypothetical protein